MEHLWVEDAATMPFWFELLINLKLTEETLKRQYLVDGEPCTLEEILRTNYVETDGDHISISDCGDVVDLPVGGTMPLGLVKITRVS